MPIHNTDCLDYLRECAEDSIDLIYIDPPFYTNRNFVTKNNELAYTDKWRSIEDYCRWLATRIKEMHRVLKGSIFVHLDAHASHYIKIELDRIFGYDRMVNEIIWHYTGGGRASKKKLPSKHDTIFWYSKYETYTINLDSIRIPYSDTSNYAKHGVKAASGKVYKPNPLGKVPDDVWSIPIINPMAKNRTGYPTEKPIALLERIIKLASNENDTIADFFCGSGTTLVAAQSLNRQFVGTDVNPKAVSMATNRLSKKEPPEVVASGGV